ncbi:anhydro-N-acetylmuramic acid kinase [Vibrio algarum]|uniref:Anhydro-N-acetylmuramic acid kinase n=1 Tax=Vibrio algarum TaxID=3020714 RepID=A0ABT4YPW3_9VIBR|nr:anhydro-N-acetylmuramic acid kinase [Vibrio sp. KJ40-1]MDB1123074.1 anhydro-N-acetylmuramic acid kinase [Vibrio sp. KJ40-1]
MNKKALYIGVMSGTSLDGIDTALVEINDKETTLIEFDSFSIPEETKAGILSFATGQPTDIVKIGQLDTSLGHLYADAVKQLLRKAFVNATDIIAIGNHGQTVYHLPTGDSPFTMQLGDANIISAKTGITTVADFRRKDMALGGQGAPLVPAFHRTIFQPGHSSVVVLNIGGIANISVLRPNRPTIGYDTGPGNMLLDAWIHQHTGKTYDKDGLYALSGKVIPELLERLCADSYFTQSPPKSTGRERFNIEWLMEKLNQFDTQFLPQDVQATLTEFSAMTICQELNHYKTGEKPELLVCGGGARNPVLMNNISSHLPDWTVCPTDDRGVNGEYMEAIAFAWLAYRRINGLPSNLPEVTGASRYASLGVIYPAE